MTSDTTPDQDTEILPKTTPPPLTGMTTKVIKGSFWTVAGQIAPLAVTLVATPFTIRLLGAESYGVLVLVALIPAYFAFADLGMGLASTRFGSAAYAAGDFEKEARTVRTAAVLSLILSVPSAIAIFTFSGWIATLFNVPEHLHREASLALKAAALMLVLNFLNSIFNTPQLDRLRMDLNAFVTSGFRMLGIGLTPIVIYLGGGILGAVVVLCISSLLTLAAHIYTSGRLLPSLFDISIDRNAVTPMINFGRPLVLAMIAAVLLENLEKVVLARVVSVEALAYYSVAYTLANIAMIGSAAIQQSLIPAFSQLLAPSKHEQLEKLVLRTLKVSLLGILPALTFILVVARPFFTLWAGEDFGRSSTMPFYILCAGLLFSSVGTIPAGLLIAYGRTGIFSKLYWAELLPYIILVGIMASTFGAVGAAIAWSARVVIDTGLKAVLARRVVGIPVKIETSRLAAFFVAAFALLVPVAIAISSNRPLNWSLFAFPICATIYAVVLWKRFVQPDERIWICERFAGFRRSLSVFAGQH